MVSYLAMSVAGFLISVAFKAVNWVPARHPFNFAQAVPTWNYTTILNLIFLVLVAVLVIRFLRTGGRQMRQMMDAVPETVDGDGGSHAHAH